MTIFNKFNSKKYEVVIASTIIFLISVIYLFPFFIGKIDTPVDVRDVLMYPWRYHAVDEKIERINLWSPANNTYSLKVSPNTTFRQAFGLDIKDSTAKKNNDSNFYLTFDFKINGDNNSKLDFGINFINKLTKRLYVPGYAVSPILEDGGKQTSWYKAYLNINSLLKDISSTRELNNFEVILTAKTNSKDKISYLNIKEMKLVLEDFSKVVKVHDYYINDLIQVFTPFREFYSGSIKKLCLPFWNNFIFTGTEFLAEPQLGYFHPIYFLCYFLFDHFTAHAVVTFISLVLSGLGAFFLARYWKLDHAASLFTAVVYMFHPFNATWFSYELMLMNSAAIPFLLLSYEKNLAQPKFFNKYLLISPLLLALIFLSGHLQFMYYTFILFFLFTLFKFLFDYKSFKRHIFSILFVSLFGIIISSIVLIPFFPLFLNSHRVSNTIEFIRTNSFPLKALLGLFFPFYGGYLGGTHSENQNLSPEYIGGFLNNYVYFGLLPLLFFILSLRKLFSDKLVAFFCFLIILSFLICTGSPIYFLVKDILPGFKQMQHFRFLQLYSYSVPFLAGIGFQLFLNNSSFVKENTKKIIVYFIFLITIIDLMYYSSFFITWSDRKSYKPLPNNGALKFLVDKTKESKEPFRILSFAIDKVGETRLKVNIAQPNTLLPYGLEDVSGCSSFIPKDIFNLFVYMQTKDLNKLYTKEKLDLFANPNLPFPIYNFKSKILNLLNVKYFMVPSVITIDPQYATKVYEGDCSIYENKNYLPRVFFVENYKVIKDPKDIIVELDNSNFDPRKEIILKEEISFTAGGAGREASCRGVVTTPLQVTKLWRVPEGDRPCSKRGSEQVNFINYDLNKIILHAKTDMPGFLVLGNNLNNNWKVKVNGKEAKHIQANLVQRAVYLPKAGNYLIEFYYYPKLFLIGAFITSFALIVLGLLALFLNKKIKTK